MGNEIIYSWQKVEVISVLNKIKKSKLKWYDHTKNEIHVRKHEMLTIQSIRDVEVDQILFTIVDRT